jgi:hypothetical protein
MRARTIGFLPKSQLSGHAIRQLLDGEDGSDGDVMGGREA